ncbi:MAG: hypothetical protein KFF49_00620 [Bacteroidales bacterium]|nr:hypothetical protein [Bacteroidales bacterium]
MEERNIRLGEREDKALVKIMIIIFGVLCLFTAAWWAVFLIRYPDNEKIFWAGSIFLFLFGMYQVYSGLGFAGKYIRIERDNLLIIRQNSLFPPKKIEPGHIRQLEIRSMDMLIHMYDSSRIRIQLGLRYPDLGQKLKDLITAYAEENNIEIFYKNEPL